MPSGFVIAIDGPVAAGKGTIAPRLAEAINGFYLYTGGTYRSLALAGIQQGIDLQDSQKVIALLPQVHIQVNHGRIILNGSDVTDRIKEPDAASGASVVGVIPKVREAMVDVQRQIAEEAIARGQNVVLEGRDTGTKVFPKAALKVFLTASDEIRAKRRLEQYIEQGEKTDFDVVLKEIRIRDKRDSQRETDPLVSDPEKYGYFVVESSTMSEEQTIQLILNELRRRKLIA